jgi:hypothetical protein
MQYSFDTAIVYSVRPNFQIDAGPNIGLNRDTPLRWKSTWGLRKSYCSCRIDEAT